MRPLDYIMESGFMRIDAAIEKVIANYPEKKIEEKVVVKVVRDGSQRDLTQYLLMAAERQQGILQGLGLGSPNLQALWAQGYPHDTTLGLSRQGQANMFNRFSQLWPIY